MTDRQTVSHYFLIKMAKKMVLFWFSLILSIICCNGSGELDILYSPDSLKFTGSNPVTESLLKEIFSAALGLSVEENSEWNGITIMDPFSTPEAIVEVHVDGVVSLNNSESFVKKYPLHSDEYAPDTFDQLSYRIKQRFIGSDNKLVSLKLNSPEDFEKYINVFGKIEVPKVSKQTLQHLKFSVEEDYQFLSELETLKTLIAKINSCSASGDGSAAGDGSSCTLAPDNVIDVFNFRFSSLHALSDYHGSDSLHTKEAKKLFVEALGELAAAFKRVYSGGVLVTAVTSDVAHTRRVRQAPAEVTLDPTDPHASATSPEYAAVFNIILWFSVVFVFSLVAIVYAIMDMDPGRDSIIYRMTSTRMKKDN